VLFDTAPEEHVWELNAKRLHAKIANVEWIQLSHWHRDHSGGMLKAISMINEAKGTKSIPVDLHPSRPTYRGIQGPFGPVSLEADPTFEEIEAAGGQVIKNDQPHTILEDHFLVSGEIPRVTPYEVGLARAIRFFPESGKWESDEQIADERFLMCNVKGRSRCGAWVAKLANRPQAKVSWCSRDALTPVSSTSSNTHYSWSVTKSLCTLLLVAITSWASMRGGLEKRWQI
jgi:hypothetical protein